MDLATQEQILDNGICISPQANAHEKGMNPSFLPPAMGK